MFHRPSHSGGMDKTPVAKVAGLKRLKTGVSGQVTGPEITSVGVSALYIDHDSILIMINVLKVGKL